MSFKKINPIGTNLDSTWSGEYWRHNITAVNVEEGLLKLEHTDWGEDYIVKVLEVLCHGFAKVQTVMYRSSKKSRAKESHNGEAFKPMWSADYIWYLHLPLPITRMLAHTMSSVAICNFDGTDLGSVQMIEGTLQMISTAEDVKTLVKKVSIHTKGLVRFEIEHDYSALDDDEYMMKTGYYSYYGSLWDEEWLVSPVVVSNLYRLAEEANIPVEVYTSTKEIPTLDAYNTVSVRTEGGISTARLIDPIRGMYAIENYGDSKVKFAYKEGKKFRVVESFHWEADWTPDGEPEMLTPIA